MLDHYDERRGVRRSGAPAPAGAPAGGGAAGELGTEEGGGAAGEGAGEAGGLARLLRKEAAVWAMLHELASLSRAQASVALRPAPPRTALRRSCGLLYPVRAARGNARARRADARRAAPRAGRRGLSAGPAGGARAAAGRCA